MGGTKPWKNGTKGFSNQSYSDGKLEIVGFRTADFVRFNNLFHGLKKIKINSFLILNIILDVFTSGEAWTIHCTRK